MLKSIFALPVGLKFVGGTVSPPSPVRKTILAADISGGDDEPVGRDATRHICALTSPALKR
jgi:hypothetical protein